MKTKRLISILCTLGTLQILAACGPAPEPVQTQSAFSTNLQAVSASYLPDSLNNASVSSQAAPKAARAFKASTSGSSNICAGLSFMDCQPRLIRSYLQLGQNSVAMSEDVVESVARDLAGAPVNSSGTVTIADKGLTVDYVKRASNDFDFLILKGTSPVGYVSASPKKFSVQFDLGLMQASGMSDSSSNNRGGKLDIEVNFTDSQNWTSQVTVTGQACDPNDPGNPNSARIIVNRAAGLWTGQAMFYSALGADFDPARTCSSAVSDSTALVFYTDFVADRLAAKAAAYFLKRTETTTAQLQNFGFNALCSNYSDLCQALAGAIGVSKADLGTQLGHYANPFCSLAATGTAVWNSDCSNVDTTVSGHAFSDNSSWLAPSAFYQLDITLPAKL